MRALVFCAALAAIACGDNRAVPRDAAPEDDAAVVPDAPAARTACVDRPTELAVAPAGELPCELLPPGFGR